MKKFILLLTMLSLGILTCVAAPKKTKKVLHKTAKTGFQKTTKTGFPGLKSDISKCCQCSDDLVYDSETEFAGEEGCKQLCKDQISATLVDCDGGDLMLGSKKPAALKGTKLGEEPTQPQQCCKCSDDFTFEKGTDFGGTLEGCQALCNKKYENTAVVTCPTEAIVGSMAKK